MSRCLLATCFGLALVLVGAWPAAAGTGVQIRAVDLRDFPQVAVTVSAQGSTQLDTADVRVLENGVAVPAAEVRPIGPSDRGADVFLAIDTSNSMRGAPLQTAFAAAKAFVERVPSWVRVGLITFADTPRIVVPISQDRGAMMEALASPQATSQWTALYDAITLASEAFTGTAQRNIIVLTDGRNNTGAANLQTAVKAAREARATTFSIGLEGADTDVQTLQQLAQLTSGTYASASANDLGAAYRSLAREISQQYVVTYRSRAPYGTQTTVSIELPGGSDEVSFVAPAPHAQSASAAVPSSALERFLLGPWALPTTVALSFLAALSLALFLFGAQARASRERRLVARMAPRPPAPAPRPSPARQEASPLTSWIPQPVVGAAGRVAQATGLAAKVDRHLERAGFAMRPGEFVAATALAALTGGLIGGVALRNPLVALAVALVAGILPWILLSAAEGRRARRIHAQLPDVLTVIASSLRAGHSFMQALDMVTKEVGEPAGSEFARVVTEIRLGRPVDDALEAMAERLDSDDFRWAVMAVSIQRRVGGNLAEVLETVAGTIRERETLRRQVRALTAEGRLSVVILTVLPFLLAVYVFVVNREYIQVLYQTTFGLALLGGAGLLMVVGYVWMRRIVDVDV